MFFHPANLAVLIIYFVGVTIIGIVAGKNEKDTNDYFLGGRKMPWLAVFCSILATECSAVTFIGAPALSFRPGGNFAYLQLAIGSLIGRIIIATIFLKPFYNYNVTTVYEYLRIRFGKLSQILGAVFFFVTRLLASGVRLYVASLAFHVVFGVPILGGLILTVGIAAIYTLFGGIKAVIWADVIQFSVFMGGAIVALIMLYFGCGGSEVIMSISHQVDKWKFIDLSFNLTKEFTLVGGIILGCIMTTASLGTDQTLTQRMLTCKQSHLAQKALIVTGIVDFPIVIIFLSIGVLLYVFYQVHPDPNIPKDADYIFPYYILTQLPPGVAGFLIAGIFSAAMGMDSALNALSSSAVCDIYRPFIAKNKNEKHYLLVSRIMVFVFGVLLIGVAYLCKNLGQVLIMAFKITSYTYGGLLGVFLIGALTKRGSDLGNLVAMLSSIAVVYCVSLTPVAWSWYIVVGTLWTFVVGVTFPDALVKRVFKTAVFPHKEYAESCQ